MMRRMLPIGLLAFTAAACVNTNVVQLGEPGRFPPVEPAQVHVYLTEADVKAEFDKVALINAEGDQSFANDERLINAMRKRAAKLGANAIILGEFKDPGTVERVAGALLGMGAERKGQVLAVRIREAPPAPAEQD